VQLFAARAAAAVPGSAVDDGNAAAVASIVVRLDGLPLAIELAAARVKLLPPAEILARLERPLALLVNAGRDVPDRQRTLRGAIAWSYELLSEEARRLLAASSVFRGGIGLASIEAVGTSVFDVPVLDGLQELVDHSLLRLSASSVTAPRYLMLETVREFAAEQLGARPEAEGVHAAHAAYFRSGSSPRISTRPRSGPRGPAWTRWRLSTTTSARPWTGTAARIRPWRCGWLTGSPRSGRRGGTSRRRDCVWASCWTCWTTSRPALGRSGCGR
jgi:non-specific serine/threonine protein kinase